VMDSALSGILNFLPSSKTPPEGFRKYCRHGQEIRVFPYGPLTRGRVEFCVKPAAELPF